MRLQRFLLAIALLAALPAGSTEASISAQSSTSVRSDVIAGGQPVQLGYRNQVIVDSSSRLIEVRDFTIPVFSGSEVDSQIGSGIIASRYNTDGTIDTSFGEGGRVVVPVNGSAILVSADITAGGKPVIAYFTYSPNFEYFVLRLNPDGSLDSTFGDAGVVTLPESSWGDSGYFNAIHVYSDGKVLLAGTANTGVAQDVARVLRLTAAGQLDSTFGGDGAVDFDTVAADTETFQGVTVDSSNRIVLVGGVESTSSGDEDSLVVRLNDNGTTDSSFGSGGSGARILDLAATAFDDFNDVVVQSSGRIVAVGGEDIDGNALVVGLTATTGALDTGFAVGGIYSVNHAGAGNYTYGLGLAKLSDNKLLVFGRAQGTAYVQRLSVNGAPDTSFGAGSTTIVAATNTLNSTAVPDSTGRIYVGGVAPYFDGRATVVRLGTNGVADASWGQSGVLSTSFGSLLQFDVVERLGNGQLLAVGRVFNDGESSVVIARVNRDGTFDESYGNDGLRTIGLGDYSDVVVTGGATQSDGKVVLAGSVSDSGGRRVLVLRFDQDGNLDSSFSADGMATVDVGSDVSYFSQVSVDLQDDGRVLVAGSGSLSSGPGVFVARLESNGNSDATFSTDGFVASVIPNTFSLELAGVHFAPNGRILVVTKSSGIADDEISTVRFTQSGLLDTTYDSDGIATTPLAGISWMSVSDSVMHPDGRISVAGTALDAGADAFVARITGTGSADPSFGVGGARFVDFGSGRAEYSSALQVDALDRLILVGQVGQRQYYLTDSTAQSSPDAKHPVVARLTSNGSLDSSFDSDGRLEVNFGNDRDEMALDAYLDSNEVLWLTGLSYDDQTTSTEGLVIRVTVAGFTTVTPTRVMDTRDGTGGITAGKIGNGTNDQGTVLEFDVRGKGGLPTDATQIGAVSLNVTAANTTAPNEGGWVAVYPCGTNPNVSNLNFINGQITPNAVITPISTTGKICFKVYGRADLIVDVNGWFPAGSGLATVTPSRIMDTRDGTGGITAGKIGNGTNDQGTVLEFDVRGKGGLPTDATQIGAVSLNVTAANTTAPNEGGWVAVYPCGTNPNVSNLNFINGQITPNAVITPISTTGKICFKVYGRADLIVDVNGWFPAGSGLATVTPSRIMDTRDGTGGITAGKIGNGTNDQGTVLEFDVRGKGGLPTDATQIGAVSLNVTAANTTAPNEGGWVAVYPCGTNPNVSNLNFINGQITPNAVITPISTTGKICFKVYGRADLIVDVNGWFRA